MGARVLARLDRIIGATRAARALERRLGASYVLGVPRGSVSRVVHLLDRRRRWVRYAEPDYELLASAESAPTMVPNDPSFGLQWGSYNTGQTIEPSPGVSITGTPGADDKATLAWGISTGSTSIVVGEPDTGVDYNHPDLSANIWSNPGGVGGCAAGTHGYDVLNSTCDPMDGDTSYGGHGTHVAGIIGAQGDNGIGVAGMNWSTTILPVRWLSTEDGGGDTSQLIDALNWLLQAKVDSGVNIRVVNDSSVYPGTAFSQALADEISTLGANGILFVTAAGNEGANLDQAGSDAYPCEYDLPTEICVTASNAQDALPSWANYGENVVDLAAPGEYIYSTLDPSLADGSYGYISGSSMAAAQVSGAAALILSVAPDMTPQELKADILDNVDQLPALSGMVRTGGRLDVCAALPGCQLPTTSSVTCTPGEVGVGQSSNCVVTVSDSAETTVTPTGTVSFGSDSSGAFDQQGSCELAAGTSAGSASCSISYTPSAVDSGTHTITATYSGDAHHHSGSGTETAKVSPIADRTELACAPGGVVVGQASSCTVTVSDTTPQATVDPSGAVSFGSDSAGAFDQQGWCELVAGTSAGSASCSISYTPSAVGSGSHTLSGTYGGDSVHVGSRSTFVLQVSSGGESNPGPVVSPSSGLTPGPGGNGGTQSAPPPGGSPVPATNPGAGPGSGGSPAPELVPVVVGRPSISGTGLPGSTLTCSTGRWLHSPVRFNYRWTRDGRLIPGADGSRLRVAIQDEGARLQCEVTAANAAGAGQSPASGAGDVVGFTHALNCPRPRGRVQNSTLGPIGLGMSQVQARRLLPRLRGSGSLGDAFCLYGGWGIQVMYAPSYRTGESPTRRDALLRIALAVTSNPYYSLLGLRPGAQVTIAARREHLRAALRVDGDEWYFVQRGRVQLLVAVRNGTVQQVGITLASLTGSRRARMLLLTAFDRTFEHLSGHRQPGPGVIPARRGRA